MVPGSKQPKKCHLLFLREETLGKGPHQLSCEGGREEVPQSDAESIHLYTACNSRGPVT